MNIVIMNIIIIIIITTVNLGGHQALPADHVPVVPARGIHAQARRDRQTIHLLLVYLLL